MTVRIAFFRSLAHVPGDIRILSKTTSTAHETYTRALLLSCTLLSMTRIARDPKDVAGHRQDASAPEAHVADLMTSLFQGFSVLWWTWRGRALDGGACSSARAPRLNSRRRVYPTFTGHKFKNKSMPYPIELSYRAKIEVLSECAQQHAHFMSMWASRGYTRSFRFPSIGYKESHPARVGESCLSLVVHFPSLLSQFFFAASRSINLTRRSSFTPFLLWPPTVLRRPLSF